MEAFVKTDVVDHVAHISFFTPQSNSLPKKTLVDLAHHITEAGANPKVNVLLLKSEGKVFCSGASFDELAAIENETQGHEFFSGFAKVINAMRKCPKFIVARIHGKCVGGGVGLAAAADYAIAVEGVDVKLSELAVGIGPFVVGPAVERKLGLSAFSQLAIDATLWRNGDWARRKGLFAELHPTVESMDASIERLTSTLVASHPKAMHEMKKMFWQGTDDWDKLLDERAAISGRLILSDYARQAIQRFKAASARAVS